MIAIGDYVYTGIEDVLFDNITTGLTEARLPLVVNLNLEATADENWVRGGLGNERAIQLVGNEEKTLTVSTATISKEFLELKTGSKIASKSTYEKVSEEITAGSDGTFTLSKTIMAGKAITVRAYKGKILSDNLTLATDTSVAEGKYKISGQKITCATGVTKIWVSYTTSVTNRDVLEIKETITKNYCVTGKLVGKNRAGETVYHQIEIPNGAISVNWGFSANNEGNEPDAADITVNALKDDEKGYTLRILF